MVLLVVMPRVHGSNRCAFLHLKYSGHRNLSGTTTIGFFATELCWTHDDSQITFLLRAQETTKARMRLRQESHTVAPAQHHVPQLVGDHLRQQRPTLRRGGGRCCCVRDSLPSVPDLRAGSDVVHRPMRGTEIQRRLSKSLILPHVFICSPHKVACSLSSSVIGRHTKVTVFQDNKSRRCQGSCIIPLSLPLRAWRPVVIPDLRRVARPLGLRSHAGGG